MTGARDAPRVLSVSVREPCAEEPPLALEEDELPPEPREVEAPELLLPPPPESREVEAPELLPLQPLLPESREGEAPEPLLLGSEDDPPE